MKTEDRLHDHVRHIAEIIENGYKLEKNELDNYDDGQYKEGDILSAYDYLQDMLDIEYTLDSQGNFIGALICVAFGGPSIYINTRHQRVEGYWWGEKSMMTYYSDPMNIDGFCEDLWGCR